ncbi:MAG TPA: hypothetical protein DCR20_11735 [Planctomycetaceae bacterium]|nr:hypothetical protein [Planctomycetaceae bacterium]
MGLWQAGVGLRQDDSAGVAEIGVCGVEFAEVVGVGGIRQQWSDIEAGDGASVNGWQATGDGRHPRGEGDGQITFAESEEFGEEWQFFCACGSFCFAGVQNPATA